MRLWPTPRASANENRQTRPTPPQAAGKHGMNLATTAAQWPTPLATDGSKPSAGNRKSADLTHTSQMWMTPTVRDHKDGATTLANTPVNGLLGRQVLTTPMAGSDTSDQRRTLSPLFVEALMS